MLLPSLLESALHEPTSSKPQLPSCLPLLAGTVTPAGAQARTQQGRGRLLGDAEKTPSSGRAARGLTRLDACRGALSKMHLAPAVVSQTCHLLPPVQVFESEMQPAWLRPRGDCSFEYATVTDEVGLRSPLLPRHAARAVRKLNVASNSGGAGHTAAGSRIATFQRGVSLARFRIALSVQGGGLSPCSLRR
jgi:hypothetical protein